MMEFFTKTVKLLALTYFLRKVLSLIYIWHDSNYAAELL